MKPFICSLYYSRVFSCMGIVWFFFPFSPFLNLRCQKLVFTLSEVFGSEFFVCVLVLVQEGKVWGGNAAFWRTLSLCGIITALQCISDFQKGIFFFFKYCQPYVWGDAWLKTALFSQKSPVQSMIRFCLGLVRSATSWMVQSLLVPKGSQQNQENHLIYI